MAAGKFWFSCEKQSSRFPPLTNFRSLWKQRKNSEFCFKVETFGISAVSDFGTGQVSSDSFLNNSFFHECFKLTFANVSGCFDFSYYTTVDNITSVNHNQVLSTLRKWVSMFFKDLIQAIYLFFKYLLYDSSLYVMLFFCFQIFFRCFIMSTSYSKPLTNWETSGPATIQLYRYALFPVSPITLSYLFTHFCSRTWSIAMDDKFFPVLYPVNLPSLNISVINGCVLSSWYRSFMWHITVERR